mgnify:FL=1
MEKSFFFNSVTVSGVPDRSYTAEDIAERTACLISDGVMSGDSLKVTGCPAAGVYVAPGAACISGYTYINTAQKFILITPPAGDYRRIDLIALKLDMALRKIYLTSYSGDPAENPTAPTPTNSEGVKILPLAHVYVEPGMTSVATSDVGDVRELGGLMSEKANLRLMLREYLGELDPLDAIEVGRIRHASRIISSNAGAATVLCGDGKYRTPAILRRVAAKSYLTPGKFEFSTADYPSEGDMYDIEIQGAGGGGGSYNGTDYRGGGGGAGAYLAVSRTVLRHPKCSITVGAGGAGVPGGCGLDGEASSFDGFTAAGGAGGGGGAKCFGGAGGVGGMCSGGAGFDGTPSSSGEFFTTVGAGGRSHFGDGAPAAGSGGAADGIAAENPGSGGSGAISEPGTFGKVGGRGGDGAVIVYRYIRDSFDDEEA